MHEWRAQPWRAIYFAYQGLLTAFLRVPWLIITNLPPSQRPHPSWSLYKCVLIPILRLWSEFGPIAEKYVLAQYQGIYAYKHTSHRTGNIIDCPPHHTISAGPGFASLWLEPSPTFFLGRVAQWAMAADVRPVRIPGYWQAAAEDVDVHAPPAPGERVVLFFHGGGFLGSSAHPNYLMGKHSRGLLAHVSSVRRALAVEYRLTDISPGSVPEAERNPFPAALLDAFAGLDYLLNVVGFAVKDVIVVGDSAGANLGLALARHLVENVEELHTRLPEKFPSPSEVPRYHLVLLSAWADMGASHAGPGTSVERNIDDYLVDVFQGPLGAAARLYPGRLGAEAATRNEYISPASKEVEAGFKGFPRTFIEVGDLDRFYDMVATLRQRMVRDIGEGRDGVKYFEAKGAVHDHLLFPLDEPQDKAVLEAIGDWVAECDKP